MHNIASKVLFEFNRMLGKLASHSRANDKSHFSPIFIVGIPRSGTTFLYQSVIDQFDVGYLHNHFNYFYGYPVAAQPYKRTTGPSSFESNYGQVKGWNSPSEHFGIWRNLFGKSVLNGFVSKASELEESESDRLRNTVYSLQNKTSTCYVFKCLYLDLCVSSLAHVFPRSRFIYLQRDVEAVRESMLKRRLQYPVSRWWSVRVPGWKTQGGESREAQVDFQLSALSTILDEQLGRLSQERVFRLHYEKFRSDIDIGISELAMWLGDVGIDRRAGTELLAREVR